MDKQVQIRIDQTTYDRLLQLCVPPYTDIDGVINALLFHEGRASRAVVALEAEERQRSYQDELDAAQAGVYDCSGICS